MVLTQHIIQQCGFATAEKASQHLQEAGYQFIFMHVATSSKYSCIATSHTQVLVL